VDKGVLGGRGEKVLLLVFIVLGFVEGDVGKGVKIVGDNRGLEGASDNIGGAVWDIEERIVLLIFKSGPDEFRGLGDNGLEDMGGNIKRAWIVPSVVRTLKDLKDGSGGVCNVLLIDIVKGGLGSNGDVGEGGGSDSGGLGGSEGHFTYTVSST